MRRVILSDRLSIETGRDIDAPKQLVVCFDRDGKEKLLLPALYFVFNFSPLLPYISFFTLSPFLIRLTIQKDDSTP